MSSTQTDARNGTQAHGRQRRRKPAGPTFAELLAAEGPTPDQAKLRERAVLLLGAAIEAFEELKKAHKGALCCAGGRCEERLDADGAVFSLGLVYSLVNGTLNRAAPQSATLALIASLRGAEVKLPDDFEERAPRRPARRKPDLRAAAEKLDGIRRGIWDALADGPLDPWGIAEKLDVRLGPALWVIFSEMFDSGLVVSLAPDRSIVNGMQRAAIPTARS